MHRSFQPLRGWASGELPSPPLAWLDLAQLYADKPQRFMRLSTHPADLKPSTHVASTGPPADLNHGHLACLPCSSLHTT